MDFKEIYKGISQKLLSDFMISAQIDHGPDKGTYREGSLKKNLEEGKLPKKYTIGHGQILSRKNEVSKSLDIVIYDNLESSPLLFDETTQIFPIEAVYGIIECKSKLSKEKLIEGLENIKSVKSIAPNDAAIKRQALMTMTYSRPKPFGAIFAYSLAENSIESLENNLKEWENVNDPSVWPNMVVILNEGIIIHRDRHLNDVLNSEDIGKDVFTSCFGLKEDSLFKFYIYLINMCSSMQLGGFNLEEYFDLPERYGEYYIKGNDKFRNAKTGNRNRIKIDFLKEVFAYCDDSKKSNWVDVFKIMTGGFINGLDESMYSKATAYLYNPENYPGWHEVENPYKLVDGQPVIEKNMCFPFIQLNINDKLIFLPYSYLDDDKWEEY